MPGMRRREFVSLLGGAAAAWPLAARAQQPAMPVVGTLNTRVARTFCALDSCVFARPEAKPALSKVPTWRSNTAGGQATGIRMPALAADLVRRQVNVLAAFSPPAALAAKAATASIPIVITSSVIR